MALKTKTLLILAVTLALGACTSADRSAGALSDIEDAGVGECEPTWETTLRTTTGARAVVGRVVFSTSATEVQADVYADAGWELGDTYLGIGHDGMEPDWTAANPEPWITGWQTHVTISMPLDAAIACGDVLKFQIQVNVRDTTTGARELASAFGPQDRAEWGWADFRPLCCDVPDDGGGVGCTLTQGFWKNHAEAWPVSSLTIGGVVYDQAALLDLLRTPVRGDASIALAHQLIAAELNVAAGASPVAAIADAQAWMSTHGGGAMLPYGTAPSSAAGAEATSLNDALAAFNEGRTGPGHCDDDRDDDMDEGTDEGMDERRGERRGQRRDD